jgi:hypothetical protein
LLATIDKANVAESMLVDPSFVCKSPTLLFPAVAEVLDKVVVKLKQYKLVVVKSPLEKLTVLPTILVACAEIPGQAVEPDGRLFVSVDQSDVDGLIVKSEGKSTETKFSTPAPDEEGAAQIVPERVEFELKFVNLT